MVMVSALAVWGAVRRVHTTPSIAKQSGEIRQGLRMGFTSWTRFTADYGYAIGSPQRIFGETKSSERFFAHVGRSPIHSTAGQRGVVCRGSAFDPCGSGICVGTLMRCVRKGVRPGFVPTSNPEDLTNESVAMRLTSL